MGDKFGNNTICQIAIVVHDIKASSEKYAAVFSLPVPEPILTGTSDETNIRYQGRPTEARAKLAFFQMGNVSLELIEPVGEPSTWKEFLDEHGEGVHHIAFQIEGMDRVLAYLDGKDIPVIQRGDYTGGRYAYVDGAPFLGVILELLENV